ncbi:MAG TPA: M20/M25/M40 family metallo-hydrolase [Pyrinomonadaceae bacterium]|jgi:acetylornithine deacetylase
MNLFELTRQLIDIPSITGYEAPVGHFLTSFLKDLGFQVEQQPVDQDRFNVLGILTNAPPTIVFSTHMDTVPPFIESSEDDENIYGRGSCDAKGIIAAQIFAAEQLRAQDFNEVGLLFTVDEEMASAGARMANNHSAAKHCRFLINGEPTDNKLALGSKGSMRLKITAMGRAAHSAYPEAGESAIEKLLDVLNTLRGCDWPHDQFFGDTTCNIGVINGGTRPNVIAASASADLQIRITEDVDRIKAIVEEALDGRASVEYSSAHNPIRFFSVPGFEGSIVRFTTDIPYLGNWGKPLLIGPGSILHAHTDHERVSKKELREAVDLYVALVERLVPPDNH